MLIVSVSSVYAQQVPLFSSYNSNKMLLSPSTTGMDQLITTSLISRLQFVGFEGAPITNLALAEFGKKDAPYGVGLALYSDRIGVLNNVGVQGNYGYRLKLSDDLKIGMGIALAFDQWNFNASQIKVEDLNDPELFNRNQNTTTFRGDFGAHLDYKNLFISVAVPRVFATDISFTNEITKKAVDIKQLRHVMAYVSYDIKLKGDKYVITPAALVRLAQDFDPQFDANVTVEYAKKIFGTVAYRQGYAASLGGGLQFSKRIRGGYAYDFPINATQSYGAGSHELMMKIRLGKILDNE